MKKLLLTLVLCLTVSGASFAEQVPQNVQDFVNQTFPETNFRFDGVIVLPDNTMYLPIFPAKVENVDEVGIKTTYPANETLKQKPDMVILNNNYSLLKVINTNGKKTVINLMNPPDEIQSGLLPQDILLPKGLVVPETLKGIIGNIDVAITQETGLKINNARKVGKTNNVSPVEELNGKSFYIATGTNKNIQVIDSNTKLPNYALEQNAVINDLKCYNGEFLLVTYFDSKVMNIISLMDEKVIKQVPFEINPEQIIIDNDKKIAYIPSGSNSSVYVFNLETMTLKRQLKINGLCEKFTLSEDGNKLFYVDRNKNNIWAIELDNNYKLKNIGTFPNISKIAYTDGKIYVISRTQNRLAIVDYETLELISELEVCEKPVDLYAHNKELFILGAGENLVEVLNTEENVITDKLFLNTNAFATTITPIENSEMIMITNARSGLYSVIDTATKEIVRTSPLDVPVRSIVITDKVKTIK